MGLLDEITNLADSAVRALETAWDAVTSLFSNKPVDSTTMPCRPPPPPSIGEFGKSKPKYDSLPAKVSIPADVSTLMQEAWEKSIDHDGNSNEHGGTLVIHKDGTLKMVNEGAGNSGSFSPDPRPPPDHKFIGTFHTHPYGKNDGVWDGAHMPQSAGDVSTIPHFDQDIDVVQSGNTKYVLVRTDQTPANLDAAEKTYDDAFDLEYKKQQAAGKSAADAASSAGEVATKKVAEEYKLGYYRGTDSAALERINP